MRRAARAVPLALGAALLTGCQLYWTRPDATLATFTADHRDCATKAGVPMDGNRLLVNEGMYKACLKTLGWRRETASKYDGAPGHYRGLEEDGVVSLTDTPAQVGRAVPGVPTGAAASSSRVLVCRRAWLERVDWRQHLGDYRDCLAR